MICQVEVEVDFLGQRASDPLSVESARDLLDITDREGLPGCVRVRLLNSKWFSIALCILQLVLDFIN